MVENAEYTYKTLVVFEFRGCGVVVTHQLPKGFWYSKHFEAAKHYFISPFRVFRKPVPCEQ
jgi:hypothetical protein